MTRGILFILLALFMLGIHLSATSTLASQAGTAVVSPEQISTILESYLEKKKSALPPARIRFASLDQPRPITVPQGKLTWQVLPSDSDILHSSRFTVILRVDGRVVANRAVRGKIEALAPVAVAATDLRRGVVLTEADIGMEEKDLTTLRSFTLDPEELLGMRMKRTLRSGEAIGRYAVETPPLVRRGDVVTIIAGKGSLLVSTMGTAQKDGQLDDTIRVRNNSSNRVVLARVTGAGSVEVEF